MTAKNRDEHARWRNVTVAFRVSPEEGKLIDDFVKLSGLTKQDYITNRLLNRDIVVQGNPRVYKALKDKLAEVKDELTRIDAGGALSPEQAELITMIVRIMDGMKGE